MGTVNDNPACQLLTVLTESNWTEADLDLQSFADAAAVCDEAIDYASQYGGTSRHARYKSNVVLRQRRSAGDIVRGIRQDCAGMLLPNRDTGLLSLLIKGTLADQQPAPVAGSNFDTAIPSVTRNNVEADGYVAYRFTEDEAISVKGIARPISSTPNRVAFQFQDSENQYAATSIALVDSDDIERVGQEVESTLQIDGCATQDQAGRLCKMTLRENHRGNPYGDTRGTRWYEIQTSIRAIRVSLGQIVMVDWSKLQLSNQLMRVMTVKGPTRDGLITLQVAWHDDSWYVDQNIQRPDDSYSNPKRNKLLRASYPLCPNVVSPKTTDVFYAATDKTFSVAPQWTISPDGSWKGQIQLGAQLPPNVFGTAQPPQIALQVDVAITGGNLVAGLLYVAISALDANGQYSPLSVIATAYLPPGTTTGSISIPVQYWAPNTVGYRVYAGRTPFRLSGQLNGDGTPSAVTLTAFSECLDGAPDQELDAVIAIGKQVLRSGICTAKVTGTGSGTISIGGSGWTANALAGRCASLLAKGDGGSLPVLNFAITGNTTDGVLSVDPSLTAESANENLLPWSENFNKYGWNRYNGQSLTVTGGQPDPNAGTAAFRIVAGGPGCGIWCRYNAPKGQVTYSVWLKGAAGGEHVLLGNQPGGYYTSVTLTANWARYEVHANNVQFPQSFMTIYGGEACTFYAFGAQVNRGTAACGYVQTTGEPGSGAPPIEVGDVIAIRSAPTVDGSTVTDALWDNPLAPGGLDLTLVGKLARVIAGTGRGATNTISTASQDTLGFATAWPVTLDNTSILIIEENAWSPLASPLRPIANADPGTLVSISVPNDNWADRTLLVGLTTQDGGENDSVEGLMHVRELFVAGKPWQVVTLGLGIGQQQAVGADVCPPYSFRSAGAPAKVEARAQTPPSGGNLVIDLLISHDNGGTWTSIFPAGVPLTIPSASSAWVETESFRSISIAAGDWLRCDVVSGSAENAQNITVRLTWG